MRTLHPSLLIGNYDWDPGRLPLAEFQERLAAVCARLGARGLAGLIVHGDALDNGALAYLTGFTPKHGSAFAFVGAGGEVWILAPGGAAMIEAAKRLTWVDDVVAGNRLAERVEAWLAGMDAPRPRLGKVAGARAPAGAMHPIAARLAYRDRSGNVAAIQAGEREARRLGVADLRTLFSLDGGAVLQPFEGLDDTRTDPLVAYIAVRAAGYWAGGFVTLGEPPSRAREAADAALRRHDRGGPARGSRARPRRGDAPGRDRPHPPSCRPRRARKRARAQPRRAADAAPGRTDALQAGGVYALRAGFADEAAGNALVSALVAVGAGETEILWRARPV